MNWRIDVGAGLPAHVYPINDKHKHVTDGLDCWCKPKILYENEESKIQFVTPIVIHNSTDFRELIEQAEQIKNEITS